MVDRKYPDLLGGAGDEVGHHLAEMDLPESRCTKARASRRTQRDVRVGLPAARQLAGQERAKVAVVLEARGDVREDLVGEMGLEVEVRADVVAARVALVRWGEAGKHLRAARCFSPVLVRAAAVDVGGQLTAQDPPAFVTECRT